jgi:hypothetical protein
VTELEPTTRPESDRALDDQPAPAPAPSVTATAALPPDPAAYDEVRNVHARARGLDAPYIAGGTDPDPAAGRREERYYGRLLLWMVIVLILGGFVVGMVIALVSAAS